MTGMPRGCKTDRTLLLHAALRLGHVMALVAMVATRVQAQDRLSQAVTDTLPGGIVRVTSPGPTGWATSGGWRLVPERVVRPAEGSAGELGNPFGLHLFPDGRLLVVDQKPMSIRLYDRSGALIRTIGREGRGPGEYLAPQVAVFGDSLFIHDHQLARGTVMSLDGAVARSFPTACCVRFGQVAVDTRGMIRVLAPLAGANRQWLVLDRSGARRDSFPEPGLSSPRLWVTERFRLVVPLSPENRGLVLRDGTLLHGSTDQYQLVVTRRGSDTVRILRRTGIAPVAASRAVRESLLTAKVGASAEARAVASLGDIPTGYPMWRELAEDGGGNLWVLAGGEAGRPPRLDVFAPTGRFLGSLLSPFATLALTSWTADHVAVLETDADDLPVIRVYRIVKPQ